MIFVAISMDDIDEAVLGYICKSNMAIQLVEGTYINAIVLSLMFKKNLSQFILCVVADIEIICIPKSVRFMINIYSIKLDR